MPTRTTDLNRFPFSNFKYFLTLFSKFFSSFPHGTCSLSVSRQYLALDGIYHPFRAAFPSNSTRRKRVIDDTCSQRQTGFSPSLIPCSNGLTPGPCRTAASVDYNSGRDLTRPDFQFELFPLHSPLLRESLLVSFPPLSYMLKSSGSSYLISDPGVFVFAGKLQKEKTSRCSQPNWQGWFSTEGSTSLSGRFNDLSASSDRHITNDLSNQHSPTNTLNELLSGGYGH